MATWIWREALEALAQVMPGSTGFLLDQVQGVPADAWQRFRVDDDVATGERLVAAAGTVLGSDLFVVTDASWRPDVGPFPIASWRLTGLMRDHETLTGEPFFGGDLVMLSPEDGAIVALHRAGLLAVARGTTCPRPTVWPLAHLTDCDVFAAWPDDLEWRHPYGEIYPETAVALPSGRVVHIRWFQPDARVSYTAPTGDFQISYRGPLEDLDAVFREFVEVVGLSGHDVMRLSSHP